MRLLEEFEKEVRINNYETVDALADAVKGLLMNVDNPDAVVEVKENQVLISFINRGDRLIIVQTAEGKWNLDIQTKYSFTEIGLEDAVAFVSNDDAYIMLCIDDGITDVKVPVGVK